MEIILVKVAASIAIVALLLKRSTVGPQKFYARSCTLILFFGIGFLKLSDISGDVMSWIGGVLLCAGITLSCFMLLTEIHWILKKRVAPFNHKP